jgi:lactate permease
VTVPSALFAAAPIVLVLVAMVWWRWRAAVAGLLGLAVALVVAVWHFGFGTQLHGSLGVAGATGGALLEAISTAFTICWIVFPALWLYELQENTGAIAQLRDGLTRVSREPHVLVLLVAWFGALFVEGVAGFGTPIALAAPILTGLGYTPVQAVTLALLGHAAGVSFGAIGTPVIPQMAATGLTGLALGRWAALLHAALGWMLLVSLLRTATRAANDTDAPSVSARRMIVDGALAALCFFVPSTLLAWFVGPELPTLGGAAIGVSVFVAIVKRRSRVAPSHAEGSRRADAEPRALIMAALPYAVLLVVVLGTRLVPPVREALQGVELSWSVAGVFRGYMAPLYHPGTLLLLAVLIGGLAQGHRTAVLSGAAIRALRRLAPVVPALLVMLALSRVTVHGGLIQSLAGAAASAGSVWPLLAPLVGVLGTFVTGSATTSNILFSDFQQATATTAALPVAPLQGAQNFGAAVGNIVCPHNIIAGGATVGLAGREGEVLRNTAVPCLSYAAAGGLVLWGILAAMRP